MLDVTDRTVVITGGATGIGFGLAMAFGARGANGVIGAPLMVKTASRARARVRARASVCVARACVCVCVYERERERGAEWDASTRPACTDFAEAGCVMTERATRAGVGDEEHPHADADATFLHSFRGGRSERRSRKR